MTKPYIRFQSESRWKRLRRMRAGRRRIGVLGLGVLGGRSAKILADLGFSVAGWSRTPKAIDGVDNFHGAAGLRPLIEHSDILVCLLPLTPTTEGIINREILEALPAGAYIINLGRGRHVVEDDLIVALDSGHVSGAVLDVFAREPLPKDSPLWHHSKVFVTPHMAGRTHTETAARAVAENVHRVLAGEAPFPMIDRTQGY